MGWLVLIRTKVDLSGELKPFLKWAGGKRWLVEKHRDVFPSFSGKYVEPFLGGGSVFFYIAPEKSLISDVNGRLIECYKMMRDDPVGIETALMRHHKNHSADYYYHMREKYFKRSTERAAQFIYLNRTCFNGLYRVNKNGTFNVPIGTKTKIIDGREDFYSISEFLSRADIECSDFEITIDSAENDDFIFVDPPYTVKHDLNGFLKYNEKIFSWDDQVRLRDAILRAHKRGAKILLTNAAHASVVKLYEGIGKHRFIQRSSVLAGKSGARGSVRELLVAIG